MFELVDEIGCSRHGVIKAVEKCLSRGYSAVFIANLAQKHFHQLASVRSVQKFVHGKRRKNKRTANMSNLNL